MNNLEQISNISKDLENTLETKFGATGKDLHEKISSVENILNENLIKKIKFIAIVKTKIMHDDGESINDSDVQKAKIYYENIVEAGLKNTAPKDNNQDTNSNQEYKEILEKRIQEDRLAIKKYEKKLEAEKYFKSIPFPTRLYLNICDFLELRSKVNKKFDEYFIHLDNYKAKIDKILDLDILLSIRNRR